MERPLETHGKKIANARRGNDNVEEEDNAANKYADDTKVGDEADAGQGVQQDAGSAVGREAQRLAEVLRAAMQFLKGSEQPRPAPPTGNERALQLRLAGRRTDEVGKYENY